MTYDRLTEHFRRAEMRCKCGCGESDMDPDLLRRLEALRKRLGRALYVVSGRRCSDHNQAVGGKPNSEHLTGQAVDVRAPTSAERYEVLEEAFKVGFTRLGIGHDFIHLGVAETHPQGVVWLY